MLKVIYVEVVVWKDNHTGFNMVLRERLHDQVDVRRWARRPVADLVVAWCIVFRMLAETHSLSAGTLI